VSFLPPLDIKFPPGPLGGEFLNLVLISVILINLFEKTKNYSGILSAFLAGFFVDIFSESFIGFHILIFLLFSLFIKHFLKRYVQPFWKREKSF
jgi:rod shape-determining protein MreD